MKSEGPPPQNSRESSLRKEVSQLKRVLAEKTLEARFFQRCLAKSRGSTPAERRLWREGIYDQIREVMSLQGNLSIERMCQLAQVSRAGFYRSLQEHQPVEEEMEVRVDHSADRAGASAPLWLSTSDGGTAAARHAGQSQTSGAADARRQPAGGAAAGFRGHH